jgi:hypothetical protein
MLMIMCFHKSIVYAYRLISVVLFCFILSFCMLEENYEWEENMAAVEVM